MPACSKDSVAGLTDSLQRLVSRYGPGICPPGQGRTAFLAPVCKAYFLCQFGDYGRRPVPAPLGDRNERSMALYNHPGLGNVKRPPAFPPGASSLVFSMPGFLATRLRRQWRDAPLLSLEDIQPRFRRRVKYRAFLSRCFTVSLTHEVLP